MPSPQPRLLLALDASSSRCSAVLWSEASRASASRASAGHALAGRVLAGIEREGQTAVAAKSRTIADLLASQKLAVRDLAATAVCVGPGSFTGLRASLAFAEGLAAGAGIPVIGVTVAEALAVAASAGAPGLPLWCALDGRHGRLFLHRGGPPDAWEVALASDPPRPETPVALTGDAAAALSDVLRDMGVAAVVTSGRSCHAREVAVAGLQRMLGRLPPLATRPVYIDPPRAALPRGGLRPPPREAAEAP
jgi:tRNA threonylcarbamoyladenosine biosynthesis protein TsaB